MDWWMKNNLRLIQTNLMETDATMDVDRLVRDLQHMSANTLMMNTGGIVSFYPTALDFHWQNPHLPMVEGHVRDLVGEVVTACHQAGIRYVARFDFSKADETIFQAHPDWFYVNGEGERMRFNGTVATCVNGWYQREGALEILREALTRYPVDGVFFNMFGYQTRDYSGKTFGICRCEGCKAAFRDMTGMTLPLVSVPEDPAWPAYRAFQHATTRRMLERIRDLVKGIRPDIAISTYDEHAVDVVRKESNTELDRPLPFWLHATSENVQSLEDAWQDKTVSNCCINAVGLDVRFMGVSPHQTRARLFGALAAGSGLDFCIIGNFPAYPDPAGPAAAAEVFAHAAVHEKEYGCFLPCADLVLVKPDRFAPADAMTEYRGLFKALKERHRLFEVLHAEHLAEGLQQKRGQVRMVLLPALSVMEPQAADLLLAMRREGVHVMATGRVPESLSGDLFPVRTDPGRMPSRSAYMETTGGWVFLSGEVHPMCLAGGQNGGAHPMWSTGGQTVDAYSEDLESIPGQTDGWSHTCRWPIRSAGRYGPPEKCGGHLETNDWGGCISRHTGGAAVLIPWFPGTLYLRHGYATHRDLLLELMAEVMDAPVMLETDAPACVEVFLHRHASGGWMLQLINHSGFNGMTFEAPLPIGNLRFTLRLPGISHATARVRSLYQQDNVCLEPGMAAGAEEGGAVVGLRIPLLTQYEAVRLET